MSTFTEPKSNPKTESKSCNIIAGLQKAYSMELETVANYLADSINLDGIRAEAIKKSLSADVQEELGHATQIAHRIKQLEGHVPGSRSLVFDHSHLEERNETTDVVRVIEAVIQDETSAVEHYKQMIRDTDGKDYVTQDLCIRLLADEEEHLTQFRGFLKEYQTT